MGWLCEESAWKYATVPKDLITAADQAALASLAGNVGEEKAMDVEI